MLHAYFGEGNRVLYIFCAFRCIDTTTSINLFYSLIDHHDRRRRIQIKQNVRISPHHAWHERDGASNHRRLDCLLNRLFRCRSKKTSNLHVPGLCEGNPPVIGGFPSQRACNANNVSILWRRHESNRNCNDYVHRSQKFPLQRNISICIIQDETSLLNRICQTSYITLWKIQFLKS